MKAERLKQARGLALETLRRNARSDNPKAAAQARRILEGAKRRERKAQDREGRGHDRRAGVPVSEARTD